MQVRRALIAVLAAAGLWSAPVSSTPIVSSSSTPQQPAIQHANATTPATTAEVDDLLAEANTLLRRRKALDAKAAFERALEGARRLSLAPQEAAALCGIGDALVATAKFREARPHALQCLELHQRLSLPRGIGWANLILSASAEMSGDYPEAKARAEQSLAGYETANDRRGQAVARLQLTRVGGLAPAEELRLLAQVVEDATAAGDRVLVAGAHHSWGDQLFTVGQYEEALDKLEGAASVYQEIDNAVGLGTVFNSIGRVYRAHGRLDEALRWQLKALELHQTSADSFEYMQSLNAVAAVYQMLGNLPKAREFYERALALAEKSSSPRIQNFLRANVASLLIEQGEFERGAKTLEQVIAGGTDAFRSVRYGQLSYAQLRMGRLQDALQNADQAVNTCGGNPSDCVNALERRAGIRTALGQDSDALTDIDAALTTLEGMRAKLVPADFFKQDFHRRQENVYSQAIALKLHGHRDADALETAELARSRAFLDLLASRDVQFKEGDQSRIASLRAGKSGVTSGSPSPVPGLVLRGSDAGAAEDAGAMRELRSLVTASPASTSEIAATAARLTSTFLFYWVSDDQVHIWVVGHDGRTRARTVSVLRSRLVSLIRSTAQTGGTPSPTSPWRGLYDLLIRPIRDALPQAPGALVTIVPHGPLLNLSFAALQDARGRYLLEDYTLHYVPASAVLQFTAPKRRSDARTGEVLLVADPSLPPRSRLDQPLPRLPGARSEATAIAKLVPREHVTMLSDKGAAESSIRVAASERAVLHFATHAVVRDDDPFGSFLALGATAGGGAAADGLLTAQEIYGLNLHADLVVLSACRSGGGRVTGDGVATFARAFIYAGTASLVASLWDVPDEPTNRLLPAFYRAWFGGQSKARALRAAQLQLLRDLRAGRVTLETPAGRVSLPQHPVFWAGFALIGEPE